MNVQQVDIVVSNKLSFFVYSKNYSPAVINLFRLSLMKQRITLNSVQQMEIENLAFSNPLLVQPQRLRKRQSRGSYCFNHKTIHCKQKQNAKPYNYSHIPSPQNSLLPNHSPTRKNINWLKYNILVGIYDNWIRLYPYIQHLLRKFPQLDHSISKDIEGYGFLKQFRSQLCSGKEAQPKQVLKRFIQALKLRRQQMLKKLSGIDGSGIDAQIIKMVNHMAQQLLSTLSIQNTKWNKFRIEKHNRLIDEAINKFNQSQFAVNSSAILSSLKERLQFIQKIQDSYIDSVKSDPNYKEKLLSLKQPFERGVFAGSKGANIQQRLQNAWNQLKNQRLINSRKKIRQKKTSKSNQRYTVLSISNNNSLVVKYKHKDGNQGLRKSKQKQKPKNQIKQQDTDKSVQNETKMSLSLYNSGVLPDDSNGSLKSSNSIGDRGKEFQKQELDNIIESFLTKTRLKPTYKDNQGGGFNRSRANKKASLARPSISYLQTTKSKQNHHRKSFSMDIFNGDKKDLNNGNGMKEKKARPSIQNLFEQAKDDHLSRFKSHKKIGTIKNLKGINSKIRLTKQQKTVFKFTDSHSKFQNSQSQINKEQSKRPFFYNRKGNLVKKGTHRKNMDRQTNFQDIIALQTDFNYKRHQIVAYLSMIKQKGLLNQQKYAHLKEKTDYLIAKNSASFKAANREYAKKMQEKSVKLDHYELPEPRPSQTFHRRDNFLKELSCAISKDQGVQMKIKQELKIFYEQNTKAHVSQAQAGNEQYLLNSVELGNLQEQLKRILQFQQENNTISLANYLRTICNKLQQKEVQ